MVEASWDGLLADEDAPLAAGEARAAQGHAAAGDGDMEEALAPHDDTLLDESR